MATTDVELRDWQEAGVVAKLAAHWRSVQRDVMEYRHDITLGEVVYQGLALGQVGGLGRWPGRYLVSVPRGREEKIC